MTARAGGKPAVSQAVRTAFDRLMAAYPARGDNPRAPALAVFARLVGPAPLGGGEDPDALVASAARFAAVMKAEAREPRMIPHTRTWLSQRRFDDYLTDVPASASGESPRPNPEHPLFWLAAEIGEAAWLSYIGPLTVEEECGLPLIVARTAFQLDRIRKAGWTSLIEARLGPACWRVRP